MILANIIENAFGPLIRLFEWLLVEIHDHVLTSGWGWSIIGLTALIRIVLFPLFVRQIKSMRTMQLHMPEMKAIQAKYKEDKQKQSEELMKFYRENHINPFASCLPLLLQFPVLISLLYMLRSDLKKHICGPSLVSSYNRIHHADIAKVAQLPAKYIEKTSCNKVDPHSAGFLFIPDLTNKVTGLTLVVLIVLYVVTMVGSSVLSTATADRNQRLMAIFLPFIFVPFIAKFPAGVMVYWISTNIWTVGQAAYIRQRMPAPKPAAAADVANKKAPGAAAVSLHKDAGDVPGADDAVNGEQAVGNGAGASSVLGSLRTKVKAASGSSAPAEKAAAGNGTPGDATPPPPPRRKKKRRSGRRR
jgi:YidC/Oxa1 family membrane protein insertase